MMYKNYEIRKMENAACTRPIWFNIYVPGNAGQIMTLAYSVSEAKQIVDQHIAEAALFEPETDDYDMDEEIEKLHNGQ